MNNILNKSIQNDFQNRFNIEKSQIGSPAFFMQEDIEKGLESDDLVSRKSFYLEKSDLFKSFSKDLQDKFPNGSWRTINGSHVFINNGKVIAGLDGFNEHIDKFFAEKKKKEEGNSISKEQNKDKYVPPFNLSGWNGKFYGNEKTGYNVYLNGNKTDISKKQKEELEAYIRTQKEKREKNKMNEKVLDILKYNIDNFLSQGGDISKLNIKGIKDYLNKYADQKQKEIDKLNNDIDRRKYDLFQGIKEKNVKIDDINSPNDINEKNYRQVEEKLRGRHDSYRFSYAASDLRGYFYEQDRKKDEPTPDTIRDYASSFSESDLNSIKEGIKKKDLSKNAKKDLINKLGGGNWNNKVYGKKGNFSIYLNSKKIDISDKDAEVLKG